MGERINKRNKEVVYGLAVSIIAGTMFFRPVTVEALAESWIGGSGGAITVGKPAAPARGEEAYSGWGLGEDTPEQLAGPAVGGLNAATPAAKAVPGLYLEKIAGEALDGYLTAREKLGLAREHFLAKEPGQRTVDAAAREDYVAAIKAINRSLAGEPRYWRSYLLGSLIYRGYGGKAQAQRYAEQALALLRMRLARDEGDVLAHLAIAVVCLADDARLWPEPEPYRETGYREAERVLELCGYGGPQGKGTAYSLPNIPTKGLFQNFDTSRPLNAVKSSLREDGRAFCAMLAALTLGDERSMALAKSIQSRSFGDSPLQALSDETWKAAGGDGGRWEFLLKCLLALPEEIGWGE